MCEKSQNECGWTETETDDKSDMLNAVLNNNNNNRNMAMWRYNMVMFVLYLS